MAVEFTSNIVCLQCLHKCYKGSGRNWWQWQQVQPVPESSLTAGRITEFGNSFHGPRLVVVFWDVGNKPVYKLHLRVNFTTLY